MSPLDVSGRDDADDHRQNASKVPVDDSEGEKPGDTRNRRDYSKT